MQFLIHKPRIVGFTVFIIFLAITQMVAYENYKVKKNQEYRVLESEGVAVQEKLNTIFNYSITATRILAYFVEKGLVDEFDLICEDLLERNKYIDALQLVEGSIIIKTYPLENNENVIGFDIGSNYNHKHNAYIARNRRELYFEGPFDLRQGGRGLVGRFPVIIDNRLWGFTAVIIRMETMLNAIGVDSDGVNNDFLYEIKKDVKTAASNSSFFDHEFDKSEQYFSSYIGIGGWVLNVKLKNSTYKAYSYVIALLGVVLSTVLAFLAWYFAYQPLRMQRLINERTQELRQKNQLLNEQSTTLTQKNAELEQFAFVASHDMQEPLRTLTTFLSKFNLEYGDALDGKARIYINFVNEGAKRMRSIIIDLLKFSSIDRVDNEMMDVDLNMVIHEVINALKATIDESNTQIKTANLPHVKGNKNLLIQVFQNLISNAIKYSDPDRPPHVEIYSQEDDQYAVIHVKDNGIGIDPQYFHKIFDVFQRLHTNSAYEGTGIGLAITKKIIEGFDGHIKVTSQIGNGSTFSVYLKK